MTESSAVPNCNGGYEKVFNNGLQKDVASDVDAGAFFKLPSDVSSPASDNIDAEAAGRSAVFGGDAPPITKEPLSASAFPPGDKTSDDDCCACADCCSCDEGFVNFCGYCALISCANGGCNVCLECCCGFCTEGLRNIC